MDVKRLVLATSTELPKTLDLSKSIPLQPITVPTPAVPERDTLEDKGRSEGDTSESKGVELQKKTVESTPSECTLPPSAPSTAPSQVYIQPIPETLSQSGQRDQPRPETVSPKVEEQSKGGFAPEKP